MSIQREYGRIGQSPLRPDVDPEPLDQASIIVRRMSRDNIGCRAFSLERPFDYIKRSFIRPIRSSALFKAHRSLPNPHPFH